MPITPAIIPVALLPNPILLSRFVLFSNARATSSMYWAEYFNTNRERSYTSIKSLNASFPSPLLAASDALSNDNRLAQSPHMTTPSCLSNSAHRCAAHAVVPGRYR